MPSRKRTFAEVEPSETSTSEPTLLQQIRNLWEFASLMEYIYLFGSVLKIDRELDVEMLEMECLNPSSNKLAEVGLALLKFVSSHRPLNTETFDEYTRRQFVAKAPNRNPFGEEEEPVKFSSFDVFTKIRVCHQLSTWTFHNPDRIRSAMDIGENEQTSWRMEPLGWDNQGRSLYVLDDDRLYRWTDAPPPIEPPKPAKKKPQPKRNKGTRASKRQRMNNMETVHDEEQEEELAIPPKSDNINKDTLGGAAWECIAITLEEYTQYLDSIRRSKDPDEKALYKRITTQVLPLIERRAEEQEQKARRRAKEIENLERMATAKRSSRLAGKAEKQREIDAAQELERKKREEVALVRREQEKQRKLEEARIDRMMTREQRLKEREVKRIMAEQEIARLEEATRNQESRGSSERVSERRLNSERERRQKELEELKNEVDEDWYFDCAKCGVHGKNFDDGTHSVACEKCNVWQHSACHGIQENQAERDDFHFVCASCSKPKIKLSLKKSTSPQDELKKTNGASLPPMGHFPSSAAHTLPPAMPKIQSYPFSITSQSPNGGLEHKQPIGYARASYNVENRPLTGINFGSQSTSSFPRPLSSSSAHNQVLNTVETPSSRPQTASWDPHHNSFNRQRMLSSPMINTPNRAQPSISPYPPSYANSMTPMPNGQSPYSTQSLSNSPRPSFSATQGNTGIQFKPSNREGSPLGVNSYSPVASKSTTAGFSPIKPASPDSPHSQRSPPTARADIVSPPTKFPSPPPASGKSPLKRDALLASPSNTSLASIPPHATHPLLPSLPSAPVFPSPHKPQLQPQHDQSALTNGASSHQNYVSTSITSPQRNA